MGRTCSLEGTGKTVQGELVRCSGKLTDEAYRNGNINWCADHERMVSFIRNTLTADDTLSSERHEQIRRDAQEILDSYDSPNVDGHGTCYYNLAESVIEWCMANSDPISRKPDPKLTI